MGHSPGLGPGPPSDLVAKSRQAICRSRLLPPTGLCCAFAGSPLRGSNSPERGAGVGETVFIVPRTGAGGGALSRLTLRCHRRRVSLRGLSLYPGLFHDQEAEGPHRRLLPLSWNPVWRQSRLPQDSPPCAPSLRRKLPTGALLSLLSSPAQSGCPKGARPVSPWAVASVFCVPHYLGYLVGGNLCSSPVLVASLTH